MPNWNILMEDTAGAGSPDDAVLCSDDVAGGLHIPLQSILQSLLSLLQQRCLSTALPLML